MFGTRQCYRPLRLVWAVALGCAPVGTPDAAPRSATTPTGSFISAQLPGEVSRATETVQTAVGPIEQHTATAKDGDARLSITASQLPWVASALPDARLYRHARDELIERYHATVVTWESCEHAGYACRLLRYDTADGLHGLARFYLHDRTLVVLNVVYAEGDDVARAFLASAT